MGGGGRVSALFYYITAADAESNLATFLGEKALCVSKRYQFSNGVSYELGRVCVYVCEKYGCSELRDAAINP